MLDTTIIVDQEVSTALVVLSIFAAVVLLIGIALIKPSGGYSLLFSGIIAFFALFAGMSAEMDNSPQRLADKAIFEVQTISPGTYSSDRSAWRVAEVRTGDVTEYESEFSLINGDDVCLVKNTFESRALPWKQTSHLQVEDTESCRAIVGEAINE